MDTHNARGAPSNWPALATLALSMLLSSLGTSIANVGLPALAQAFDARFQDVQWIVLAYLLAITTLIVGAGRLGDLLGRKRLLLAGLALFTAASVLCGFAASLELLILARAAQGLGAAFMMALTMAFVSDAVPKEKTGSAMGLLGTTSAIGTALGPSLGGVLIAAHGWPAIFFINLPLGVLAWLLAWRTLPAGRRSQKNNGTRFDLPGMTLLAFTLSAYALAMTSGRGAPGLINAALLVAAFFCAGLFAHVEARAASPLIRPAMFRDPRLGAGFAMNILATTVVMATLVVGPFHLAGALALDAAQVGLAMSSGPAVAALVGVPAGRIVDRIGVQRTTAAGLAAMTVGAVFLCMMPNAAGIPGYVAPLTVITAGYSLFQAANNTAVMADLDPDRRGVVSGLLNLSRNLGLITGASLMGALFAYGAGTADIASARPEAIASGTRLVFAVAAVMAATALAVGPAVRGFSRRSAAGRRALQSVRIRTNFKKS